MAKTEQIITSIIEQCTGKIPSDDTRIEPSFVLYKANSVRALIIKEDIVSGRSLSESYFQMKCCLEVKCDEVMCAGISSNSIVYYVELPKLIEGIGWKNITYFGTVEFPKYRKGLSANFDRYNFKGFLGLEFQEWAGKRPSYTVLGGYQDGDLTVDGMLAYIKNLPTSGLKYICVNGIWANPEEGICDSDDFMAMEYPFPEHHIHRLELIVIQQLLSTEVAPGDPVQDSRDNTGSDSMNPNAAKNLAKQQDFKQSE